MAAIQKLMTKSFLERAISGIILVLIAAVTITIGKDILLATTLIISLIGIFELLRIYKMQWELPGFAAYAATIVYYILIRTDMTKHLILFFIIYLVLLLAIYVFSFPKYHCNDIIVSYFGVFYVVLMLSYIYQVRMLEDGIYIVWLIFLCSWGCDTCAYLAGVMFGKHKMAPILSPKKTFEGSIGGVLGAAFLGFLYALIFNTKISFSNATIVFPVICAVGGLISQIGDLAASGIKRNHEVKDYSHLIPGHGGILDRFDSVIITAPIIYYLITLLG